MAHSNRFEPNGKAAKLFAAFLALAVWQLAADRIRNRILLVGPIQVAQALWGLVPQKDFWVAVGFTFTRITVGFLLAFLLALVLAAICGRYPLLETLLRPYMLAVQTVPVASFIVLALFWLSSGRINLFIAFLMVLPVLYSNLLQGIRQADPQLLEMAAVFRMSLWRKIRCIYVPAVRPYVLSACRAALGLCWKAGVAAEVIGVTRGSIGGMLYEARIYLEIAELFAWTLVVVAVSVIFEKCFLWLLNRALGLLEGA